jgi:hypothetical protein
MPANSEILAELLALCRDQWETIRRVMDVAEIRPKALRSLTGSDLTVPQLNGTVEQPLRRARATKHFPTLTTSLRRDKVQELLLKNWLSKAKLVREVRKALNLTNYPKYEDGGDVLTSMVYADFSLIQKSKALEETTGINGTTEYRFIPGAKVNWTK